MKFLITGANGQLGRAFQETFTRENTLFTAVDIDTCDITDPAAFDKRLTTDQPDVVINCAAYNLVDQAEDDPTPAFKVNAHAVKSMADSCARRGIKFIHFGTDYVFNGRKGSLYTESDPADPLNVYGKSKRAGEQHALAASANNLVLRTSWVIGPGKQNFLFKLKQWSERSDTIKISEDEISVPTFTSTLVEGTLAALRKDLKGLYHLTNTGHTSRLNLARAFFEAAGIKGKILSPVPMASFGLKATRPVFSAMSSKAIAQALGMTIPTWQEALKNHVASRSS